MRPTTCRVLRAAFRHWRVTWLQRARELLVFQRTGAWQGGYGPAGAPPLALCCEAAVRLAELGGAGVLATAGEWFLASGRYRRLRDTERAFAKTYFTDALLDSALIDEGAQLSARKLDIAFVFGTFVKTYGQIPSSVLVHELVHVAQFRRWGWSYVVKALWAQHFGAGYTYDAQFLAPNSPGIDSTKLGHLPSLDDLNAEQEAARMEDLARLRLGLAVRYARRSVDATALDA